MIGPDLQSGNRRSFHALGDSIRCFSAKKRGILDPRYEGRSLIEAGGSGQIGSLLSLRRELAQELAALFGRPGMSEDEVGYFTRRANQEYAAAENAGHGSAAMAHLMLAEMYVDKVYAAMSVPAPRQPVLTLIKGASAFG